jgi:hypothetical protein
MCTHGSVPPQFHYFVGLARISHGNDCIDPGVLRGASANIDGLPAIMKGRQVGSLNMFDDLAKSN